LGYLHAVIKSMVKSRASYVKCACYWQPEKQRSFKESIEVIPEDKEEKIMLQREAKGTRL
jgi:hypothetical protein